MGRNIVRILQVIAGLHRIGGTTTFAGELSNALAHGGEFVSLAMFRERGNDDFPLDPNVQFCPVSGVKDRPGDFDIVHVHGLWDKEVFWSSGWAIKNGIPLVWSPHGMLAPWALRNRWWKKFIPWHLYVRRRLARAAAIHVTAEQEAEWVRALGFKCHTRVVPLGTDVASVKVCPACTSQDDRHVLLFVGRLHPVKGLENLLAAWKNVVKDVHNWSLRLVGCGAEDYENRLRRIVQDCGIEGVDFVGAKYGADLQREYEQADCLVLPSFTENFGGVVVDALAHGIPVIASSFTPWREIDGQCGWWRGNSTDELTSVLHEMMALSDTKRREMGICGRKLVEEKYTWAAVAEQMRKVYNSLIVK